VAKAEKWEGDFSQENPFQGKYMRLQLPDKLMR
jgi:hypothetical protein